MLFGASIFCTMFPCLTRFAHTFFHTSTSCSRAILSFDCRRQPEWYRDLCLLPRRARTVVTSLNNCGNFPGPGKLPQLVFPVFPHRDMERQILCAKCLQPEPSSRRTTSRVWQPPMTSSDLSATTNPNTIEDIARKVNYAVGATKIFMQLVTHIDPLAWVLRYQIISLQRGEQYALSFCWSAVVAVRSPKTTLEDNDFTMVSGRRSALNQQDTLRVCSQRLNAALCLYVALDDDARCLQPKCISSVRWSKAYTWETKKLHLDNHITVAKGSISLTVRIRLFLIILAYPSIVSNVIRGYLAFSIHPCLKVSFLNTFEGKLIW